MEVLWMGMLFDQAPRHVKSCLNAFLQQLEQGPAFLTSVVGGTTSVQKAVSCASGTQLGRQ